jgi:hypothetical protein
MITDGRLSEPEKRVLLWEIAKLYDLHTFVETGTHDGDTVAAMLDGPWIERIFSFELSATHVARARARFTNETRANILEGDSATGLRLLMAHIHQPTLFWLDAHPGEPGTAGKYGECPLYEELRAIFKSPDGPAWPHVVLIDDARLFPEQGWPSFEEVRLVANRFGWDVSLVDDIVRCTPPELARSAPGGYPFRKVVGT